jgi:hypothetical protein
MLNNFFIDHELYLSFLEISINEIPIKNEKIDLQDFFKVVEQKFRIKARMLHPDFGGNKEDFEFLLNCKKVLMAQEEKEKIISLTVDEKYEGFDKNKIASQLGDQLFELINSWSNVLNIKAIKKPQENEDDNEWIFNILDSDKQLSLNVQKISDDLLELAKKQHNDESLNVLVCLFVPSKKLFSIKNQLDNSTTLKFNDLILIETTNSQTLRDYFSDPEKIKQDLDKIRNNLFVSRETEEIKIMTTKEASQKDKELFDKISDLKLFNTVYNEKAADFINNL